MDTTKLTQFYDDLKSSLNSDKSKNTYYDGQDEKDMYKSLNRETDKLKEDCRKHILVDMYCKIIPLDDDYVDGNMGLMKSDIDSMLANKGMTATQYLTSAKESTKSPLVEYVLRMTDLIGNQFFEDGKEKIKEAEKDGYNIPTPEAPSVQDKEIENSLIDIKDDNEYGSVIEKLREKTIGEIVSRVSDIINSKKEESDMKFDVASNETSLSDQEAATESVVSFGLNYLQKKLMTEHVEVTDEIYENMLGTAIRESTLNQMDLLFNQPDSDVKSMISKIRYNKGTLINESTANYFVESAKTPEEVQKVITDAKKSSDQKIDSSLKASDVLNAADEKKKKEEEEKKNQTDVKKEV